MSLLLHRTPPRLRALRRRPGATLVSLAVLAIGVGAAALYISSRPARAQVSAPARPGAAHLACASLPGAPRGLGAWRAIWPWACPRYSGSSNAEPGPLGPFLRRRIFA